ncbi:MAG: SBBP repeat-containing protein [Bacteroidia bacterium]
MKTKLTLLIILLSLFFIYEEGMAQAPGWDWAKSAGGIYSDIGNGIATDANGNVYVTGRFSGTITFGSTTLTYVGGDDIFIVKYDGNGNVLWAKSAGGTFNDEGTCISTDAGGNIYVSGFFQSPSLTFGSTTLSNSGGSDIFIVKYDGNGNVLWAKSTGGTDTERGNGIATTANGNVYITGLFNSTSIAFGSTTLTNANAGIMDVFIAKYDGSGNELWAESAGGTDADIGFAIASDASGDVYITGYFASSTITFGSTTLSIVGAGADIFIVKYDAGGNVLWAKQAGDFSIDIGYGIATDAAGNVYVTGYFGSASITFGSTTLTNTSFGNDIFTVKYDGSGNVLWAKSAGGTGNEVGQRITTDPGGNVYVTGDFQSSAITFGSTTLSNTGQEDIFIVKYDGNGNVPWAVSAGGTSGEGGQSIATNSSGNVYVTGYFVSPSITFGSTTLTNVNGTDFFVAKLSSTTGIAEQNPNNGVTLYPNPATDYLTIKTGINKKQVITITDITGKIIYTTTTLSDKTIINTKDFSQGVYAVQVQAADFIETKKVIVVR